MRPEREPYRYTCGHDSHYYRGELIKCEPCARKSVREGLARISSTLGMQLENLRNTIPTDEYVLRSMRGKAHNKREIEDFASFIEDEKLRESRLEDEIYERIVSVKEGYPYGSYDDKVEEIELRIQELEEDLPANELVLQVLQKGPHNTREKGNLMRLIREQKRELFGLKNGTPS